ncbi:kinase-like protein [Mytilinidion resinicola]|uniref:Kinase-like protein n=1 Tax=Mytilinidion resinicola TaxID=574789 RepID=A0A6A6YS82_9PEZI|nr:kinase-like protein [Mytilinidion resinicola]KAF2811806.1 kinase-like protein [Mytilinidion resinicola]
MTDPIKIQARKPPPRLSFARSNSPARADSPDFAKRDTIERLHKVKVDSAKLNSLERTECIGQLDALAPINFAKVHTVEHNVKVREFGDVAAEYEDKLWAQFRAQFSSSTTSQNTIHHDYNAEKEDPYRSTALLGRESFGFVDQVEARLRNQAVYAHKLFRLPTVFPKREKLIEEIKEEARITHRLRHHHIVTVFETYQWRQHFGIIMRPVAQSDLAALLDEIENEKTADAKRADLLQRIPGWCGCPIQAMVYVHQKRVRHKDIKPSNIMIKDGVLFLTDFGLAEDMAEKGSSGTEGSIGLHTARYCAPEVVQDAARRGRSADIFSLDCVFLELATVSICSAGGRARLWDYRLDQSDSFVPSTAYSSCSKRIAHWILYLWANSNSSGFHVRAPVSEASISEPEASPEEDFSSYLPKSQRRSKKIHTAAQAGSLIADLAFFMMDPEPSERMTADQLSLLLRNSAWDYSSRVQAGACETCQKAMTWSAIRFLYSNPKKSSWKNGILKNRRRYCARVLSKTGAPQRGLGFS